MLRRSIIYGLTVTSCGAAVLALILGMATYALATSYGATVQAAIQRGMARQFPGVKVTVNDRTATLSGSVRSYQEKLDAERLAQKDPALSRIDNRIVVDGPATDDRVLAQALDRKLADNASAESGLFDAYGVQVHSGFVTISGYAHNEAARNAALGTVASETGVKCVTDDIVVLPAAATDERIRVEAAKRICAANARYAAEPSEPIRIIVNDGNIILEGMVPTSADSALVAAAAANTPGVFSVTNNLQVNRKG